MGVTSIDAEIHEFSNTLYHTCIKVSHSENFHVHNYVQFVLVSYLEN